MLKRLFMPAVLAGVCFAAPVSAAVVDLEPFNTDFNTLMTGIARDVAPSLQLGALSADSMGDATIDHFNLSLLSFSLTTSDGIAKVLKPGAAQWDFVLPLADLINKNLNGVDFFQSLMVYPGIKLAAGLALGGGWDIQATGILMPQELTSALISMTGQDKIQQIDPKFSFGNLGLKVRKTVIQDSGAFSLVPAFSLGAGYTYSYFDLGVNLQSLTDLGVSKPEVSAGTTIDMTGLFSIKTFSHNATLDLQVSKHLLIFTPYFKLSGAYQNTTFDGTADLMATLSTGDKQKILSHPSVNISRFTFLTTGGLDINLFLVNLNVNVVADLGRAFLEVKDFTLDGIAADAFSLNLGLRFAF